MADQFLDMSLEDLINQKKKQGGARKGGDKGAKKGGDGAKKGGAGGNAPRGVKVGGGARKAGYVRRLFPRLSYPPPPPTLTHTILSEKVSDNLAFLTTLLFPLQ